MAAPKLFFGRIDDPTLLEADAGYTDDGVAYDLRAHTQRVAPAGTGGECIFPTLYLTTTHYENTVRVYVTPFVDGAALEQQMVELVGVPGSTGETRVHEIALYVPYLRDGVEEMRVAPRGTWLAVEVETRYAEALGTAGPQAVDLIEYEVEVVREGDTAGEAAR
jgi:hypothetical protein